MSDSTVISTEKKLDILLEKTTNIEAVSNNSTIRRNINDQLKTLAKRERSTRKQTLTFLHDQNSQENIKEIIQKIWVNDQNEYDSIFWQDKEHIYAQFISQTAKQAFLEMLTNYIGDSHDMNILKNRLINYGQGRHFQRKPVKVVINNVKTQINISMIKKNIEKISMQFEDLKEGKIIDKIQSRVISFKTNAEGIRILFMELDGSLPIFIPEKGLRARLNLRINTKPWQCRECGKFGQHQCEGKICFNCGQKGHNNQSCVSITKYCSNCKKKGHKIRDIHCPSLMIEIVKEIRKMDIPLEFLEEEETRFHFTKFIQLK